MALYGALLCLFGRDITSHILSYMDGRECCKYALDELIGITESLRASVNCFAREETSLKYYTRDRNNGRWYLDWYYSRKDSIYKPVCGYWNLRMRFNGILTLICEMNVWTEA